MRAISSTSDLDAFKQKVLLKYHQLVQDRIDAFRDMISALAEDSRNDAKGSAGDKHETALSMMQLEQEKLNIKLQEFLDQKSVLDRIAAVDNHAERCALGSLVTANDKIFFISAALPKINIGDMTIYAVSPQSPLGSQMLGKMVGEKFTVNGNPYRIAEVK